MSERVVQAPTTPFTLLTPGRIVFGRGAADGAAAAIAAMGLRPPLPNRMADLYDRSERVVRVENDLAAIETLIEETIPT